MKPNLLELNGWTIECRKSPIMKSTEMDAFQKQYEVSGEKEFLSWRSSNTVSRCLLFLK